MALAKLLILLTFPLKCGHCEGVLIQLNDPALLAINAGQPIDKLKTFVRGEIEGFEQVLQPNTNCIGYQYTLTYDDSVLLDPSVQLRDCDVKKICCADCVIDYVDELEFAVAPAETVTTLVDNADNTFTYTSEDATVTNFDAEHDLSQPLPGTIRLTKPDTSFDEVVIAAAAETVTTLVDNTDNTFTYTSEDATVTNFDVAHTLSEPVPNTVRLTRPDGSFDDVVLAGGGGSPGDLRITRNVQDGVVVSGGSTLNFFTSNWAAGFTRFNYWHMTVPLDWDTSQDPTFIARGIMGTTGVGEITFQLDYASFSLGDTVVTAEEDTISFQELGTGVAFNALIDVTSQNLDRNFINPGDSLRIGFRRNGAFGSDTFTGNFWLLDITVVFPRTNFGVTT